MPSASGAFVRTARAALHVARIDPARNRRKDFRRPLPFETANGTHVGRLELLGQLSEDGLPVDAATAGGTSGCGTSFTHTTVTRTSDATTATAGKRRQS